MQDDIHYHHEHKLLRDQLWFLLNLLNQLLSEYQQVVFLSNFELYSKTTYVQLYSTLMYHAENGIFQFLDPYDLQILEVDQKELAKATKEIWPKAATSTDVTEAIATYKIGEKTYEIKMGERLEDREIGAAIKQGGVKKFIANLTEFGKEWITKSHVSDQGPFSGKTIFPNINSVALRFKFEKNDLKKELKIKE